MTVDAMDVVVKVAFPRIFDPVAIQISQNVLLHVEIDKGQYCRPLDAEIIITIKVRNALPWCRLSDSLHNAQSVACRSSVGQFNGDNVERP